MCLESWWAWGIAADCWGQWWQPQQIENNFDAFASKSLQQLGIMRGSNTKKTTSHAAAVAGGKIYLRA